MLQADSTKPLIVSLSDTAGGASRAALRLHLALRAFAVDSRMRVRVKRSGEWHVLGPSSAAGAAFGIARQALGERLASFGSRSAGFRSLNVLPSRLSAEVNRSEHNVVNLHWIGSEAVSIPDVGRIAKPLVWTLHDMWPFCGAEHNPLESADARWRSGYEQPAAPWPDVDRWVWTRKFRAWRTPMHVICPSRWLAGLAADSALMRGWPIHVIPNPLDTDVFKPLGRTWARRALGLPDGRPVLLFGAIRPSVDHNKGLDLLLEALRSAAAPLRPLDPLCVVFGQSAPREQPRVGMDFRWLGTLHDEVTLALLYSAADVTLVPSRQENLPQTATEAAACGCPVVAFETSGLRDAVEHGTTGYLARPFATDDFAHGLVTLVGDGERLKTTGEAARARAVRLWSVAAVVPAYLKVYAAARADAAGGGGTP